MFKFESHDRDRETHVCTLIVQMVYIILYIGLKVKSRVVTCQIINETHKPMIVFFNLG